MAELLAPAGDMEALIAAISNGCDAVYLGMNQFGARAYAKNFDYDSLKEAVIYAHLRDVKVYVAMNTILFDNELDEAYKQVDLIYKLNVDGIIVQDLSLLRYIVHKYPNLETHISTQMGIDDLHGVNYMEKLGAKRVVLARECSIDTIKHIKSNSTMPIEIFVHGALCMGYSGNCLISGLIGFRSANRGRCVGNCRKSYTLVNETTKQTFPISYLLSMKDLNSITNIEAISVADSLKIEGRMKDATYVANVIKTYRQAMDNKKFDVKLANENLEKTFHRTFTKGYMFNENVKDITNIIKPNNFGYPIGYVSAKLKDRYEITLSKPLNQQDNIRIASKEEVNLKVTKIYNEKDLLINKAEKKAYLKISDKININDKVYITSDVNYLDELRKTYPSEFKRFPLDITISGKIGNNLNISIKSGDLTDSFTSSFELQKAINSPTSTDAIHKQLSKLNDSVYFLDNLNIYIEGDYFIVIKDLNEIRRQCVNLINELRLHRNLSINDKPLTYNTLSNNKDDKTLAVFCNTKEQFEAASQADIDVIYYNNNVIRRNNSKYIESHDEVLVGGYGSLDYYKGNKNIVTDFSLNVTNSDSLYSLLNDGIKRVTISHELNKKQINQMIDSFVKKTGNIPNLEMIVYGRADLMFNKYCPLKKLDLCSQCRTSKFSLKDDYASFPLYFSKDCHTTVFNSKILNLVDELDQIKNIYTLRLQFTTESHDEVLNVIKMFKERLKSTSKTNYFNDQTNTRGHFNKEIL